MKREVTAILRFARRRLWQLHHGWVQPRGGPAGRLRRRWLITSAAVGVIVTILALPKQMGAAAASACKIGLVQPWLSDTCADWGVPGLPAREERIAWQNISAGDCAGLRDFRRKHVGSIHDAEAVRLLALGHLEREAKASIGVQRWPGQYVSQARHFVSEDIALADARQRALSQAADRCALAGDGGRLESASVEEGNPNCRVSSHGTVCGLNFAVTCRLEVHRLHEVCE